MTLSRRSLAALPVEGRTVLVRVDFNVPVDPEGRITDDTRIRASLPTLRELLTRGARPVCLCHFGRPKGQVVDSMRVDPIAPRLEELLGAPVVKITGYRVVGALLLVAGGVLSVASELTHGPNASAAPVTLLLALIPLGAGYIGTLQAAINFKLAKSVGMPLLATFTSFAVATLCVGSSVAACGLPYDAGLTLSGMPIWAFRRPPRARARVRVAVLT